MLCWLFIEIHNALTDKYVISQINLNHTERKHTDTSLMEQLINVIHLMQRKTSGFFFLFHLIETVHCPLAFHGLVSGNNSRLLPSCPLKLLEGLWSPGILTGRVTDAYYYYYTALPKLTNARLSTKHISPPLKRLHPA